MPVKWTDVQCNDLLWEAVRAHRPPHQTRAIPIKILSIDHGANDARVLGLGGVPMRYGKRRVENLYETQEAALAAVPRPDPKQALEGLLDVVRGIVNDDEYHHIEYCECRTCTLLSAYANYSWATTPSGGSP